MHIWVDPRFKDVLSGDKDAARRLIRKARAYCGWLFDSLRSGQTYKPGLWTSNGYRIEAHVWNDSNGRRAIVRIFCPEVSSSAVVVLYTTNHGLWVTDAYSFGLSESWAPRETTMTYGDVTETAPEGIEAITKRVSGLGVELLAAIQYERHVNRTSAGLNFRQATTYSGKMRKHVQMLFAAGQRANFTNSWADSTGLIQENPDAEKEPDKNGWLIRINKDGVFGQKVAYFDQNSDDPILDCTTGDPGYYPEENSGTWTVLADASAVSDFYEGSAMAAMCGWAFNYVHDTARNVCFKMEDIPHNDNQVMRSYLYELVFGWSGGFPTVTALTEIESGRVFGVELHSAEHDGENMHGNYWMPQTYDIMSIFTPFTDVADWETPVGNTLTCDETAPVYCWSTENGDWRIFRWWSFSQWSSHPYDTIPSRGMCNQASQPDIVVERVTPSGTYAIRHFGPVGERTNSELSIGFVYQRIRYEQKSTNYGHAWGNLLSAPTLIGQAVMVHNWYESEVGLSRTYRCSGSVPLFDRESMLIWRTGYSSDAYRTTIEGLTSGIIPYGQQEIWGSGCSPPEGGSIWRPADITTHCGGGHAATGDVFIRDFTRFTGPAGTPGLLLNNANPWISGDFSSCAWLPVVAMLPNYTFPQREELFGSCSTCQVITNESYINRRGISDVEWYWAFGHDDLGKGSGKKITAYSMFDCEPIFTTPVGMLRDAVTNQALAWPRFETVAQASQLGLSDTWVELKSTDGHYHNHVKATYSPSEFFISMRPVFCGVPYICES